MHIADLDLFVCPDCNGPLRWHGTNVELAVDEGLLTCRTCAVSWHVALGWVRLTREDGDITREDRLLRRVYDTFPRWHDAAVRYTLPLFQTGGSEEQFRRGLVERLELGSLTALEGRPIRILEVGVGTGANLRLLREALPAGLSVEIWGCDVSIGMLTRCRERCAADPLIADTRLFMADAHALPFADDTFDRVFHVGGIAAFSDQARALAEMVRVAQPDTPIVVVDEELDPALGHNPWHRFWFKAVTFYDTHPHAPVEHLPPGARDVKSEPLSRFLYCMSFRAPAGPTG